MDINYIKLGITLFLAMTASSFVVDGTEALIASAMISEATEQLEIANKKREHDRISQAQQRRLKEIESHNEKIRILKQNKIDAKNRASIQKTNNEMCTYWSKEYTKSRTEYNLQMKRTACKRARND